MEHKRRNKTRDGRESERWAGERWQWRNNLASHGLLWQACEPWERERERFVSLQWAENRGTEEKNRGVCEHFEVRISLGSWANTCIIWMWGESSVKILSKCFPVSVCESGLTDEAQQVAMAWLQGQEVTTTSGRMWILLFSCQNDRV